MRMEKTLVKNSNSEMSKFFKDQKERYLANYQKSGKIEVKEFVEIDETWATVEIIEPMLYNSIMGGQELALKFFTDGKFKPNVNWISQWVAQLALKEARLITDTTKNDLMAQLKEGADNGESVAEISKRVEGVFDFASQTRATLIARTETTRGIAEGQRENYSQLGYYDMKWILSNDACDQCSEKADQEWNIDTIQDEQPVHPNCSCSMCPKGSLLSQLD